VSVGAASNADIFAAASTGGTDVWFSSDRAGTSPINAKLIYWSDSNSVFAFEVAIAIISAIIGAKIYLQVGSMPGGYGTDPYPATVDAVYPLASSFDDASSNANNATASGGVTAGGVTGPDGQLPATAFDGIDDIARAAYSAPVFPYTISAWSKGSDVVAGLGPFFGFGNSGLANHYSIAGLAVGKNYCVVRSGSTNDTIAGGSVVNDEWYAVSLVALSATSRSAYLDGSLIATETASIASPTVDEIWIGAIGDSSPAYKQGHVASCMLDMVGRSASAINADYLLQGSTAAAYWTVSDVTLGGLLRRLSTYPLTHSLTYPLTYGVS